MRIAFPTLPVTPREFLRKASYADHRDHHATQESWVKRLGPDFYPRYHAYVEEGESGFIVNLHLDQKKPSYEGTAAHGGEYDGAAVEREATRLKGVASAMIDVGAGLSRPDQEEKKKKGFFGNLFG